SSPDYLGPGMRERTQSCQIDRRPGSTGGRISKNEPNSARLAAFPFRGERAEMDNERSHRIPEIMAEGDRCRQPVRQMPFLVGSMTGHAAAPLLISLHDACDHR